MVAKMPQDMRIGNPDADTEEGKALLQEIVDLLVAGGYFRARISTLAPFDKLVGGLAWSITASNVDVDFDLFYDDDASLGYKIKLGENIELALQRMDCPHPLQAHQIQGLDYPAVLPVVQWLIKQVMLTREERGHQLRRFAHFQFSEGYRYALPDDAAEKEQQVTCGTPSRGALEQYDRTRLLCRGREVVLRPSQSPRGGMDANGEEQEDSVPSPAEQVVYLTRQAESAEVRSREAQEREQQASERLNALENEMEKKKAYNARALAETEKLQAMLQTDEQRQAMPLLMSLVRRCEELKAAEVAFRGECKAKRAALKEDIARLSQGSVSAEDERRLAEVEAAFREARNHLESLKKALAKQHRAVALLARRLDDVPTRAELVQYEKRFVELYEQVQRKHLETRRYFATYNALADAHKFALKELSLLNSIHSQFEAAIASPGGRAKLVESMEAINKGVQQSLDRSSKKLGGEKENLARLEEKHSAAMVAQRRYYALVKRLQEECSRGEKLQQLLKEGQV